MTNPAYEATNSDVEKVEKKKYPSDNYLNEILTNTEFAAVVPIEAVRCMARELMLLRTPHPNGMMQLSNELAEMKRKCGASNAVTDVIAERQRQTSAEGWTPEHDDEHDSGEMAGAAACYARYTNARGWIFKSNPDGYRSESEPNDWPWSPDWWKPTNPRRDLVKAGALIIAEIERIDRTAGGAVEGSE